MSQDDQPGADGPRAGSEDYAGTPRPDAVMPALDEGQLAALREIGREWDPADRWSAGVAGGAAGRPSSGRTTADSPGYAHGLAVGAGSGIDAAMLDLDREGRRQAQEILAVVLDEDPAVQADAEWQFQIIDVRLRPGHHGDPQEAWIAYGTLCSNGRTPWAANYWDSQQL